MDNLISKLKERILLIEKTISESITNHNGLIARLEEAKYFLKMAEELPKEDDAVKESSLIVEDAV